MGFLLAYIATFLIGFCIVTKNKLIIFIGLLIPLVGVILLYKWAAIFIIATIISNILVGRWIYKTLTEYKNSTISKKFELFYFQLLSSEIEIAHASTSKRYSIIDSNISVTIYNNGAVDIFPRMFTINKVEKELLCNMLETVTILRLTAESLPTLGNHNA